MAMRDWHKSWCLTIKSINQSINQGMCQSQKAIWNCLVKPVMEHWQSKPQTSAPVMGLVDGAQYIHTEE